MERIETLAEWNDKIERQAIALLFGVDIGDADHRKYGSGKTAGEVVDVMEVVEVE